MTDFHIRKDAQNWFKKIKKDLDSQPGHAGNMSMYYFCALVGLTFGKKSTVKSDELASLVSHFPQQFDGTSKLLIAAFLSTEVQSQGLRLEIAKRDQIQNYIKQFIHPEPPHLTAEGVKRLDAYAHGGFDVLQDEIVPPETLEGFLSELRVLLSQKQ